MAADFTTSKSLRNARALTHSIFLQFFFSPTTIPSDQFWFHSVPNDDTLIASTMPLPHTHAASSFLACALHALLPSHGSSHRSTSLRYDLAVSCFLLTVLRHKMLGCLDEHLLGCSVLRDVRAFHTFAVHFLCYTFILTFLRFWLLGSRHCVVSRSRHYAVIEMCDCFRTGFTVVSLRFVKYLPGHLCCTCCRSTAVLHPL